MVNNSFQVTQFPTDDILDGNKNGIDLGAGEWLNFVYVPVGLNLYIQLDGNSLGAKIPVKSGLVIKGKHGMVYFWTDTALAGEFITVVQGAGSTDIVNPPSTVFDSLGLFGASAESQLLEMNGNFSPKPTAIQTSVASSGSYVLPKGNIRSIRVHCTDVLGVELDGNGVKYPIYEDIINLNNIDTSLTFHNDTGASITLTAWTM